MTSETRPGLPFVMVGDAEAAACADGVCATPAAARDSRQASDQVPADGTPPGTALDSEHTEPG
jgi:hypothetical protein